MNRQEAAKILDVNLNASFDETKKAYKKQAAKYHPDNQTTGDSNKFKEINEAYQVLSGKSYNPKSQQYSRHEYYNPFAGKSTVEDFFERFGGFNPFRDFYSSRRENRKPPTQDHEITVNFQITIEDIKKGKDAIVSYELAKECVECNGKGAESFKNCDMCNGRGLKQEQSRFMATIMPCDTCKGEGSIYINPCKKCNALGFVKERYKLAVEIKAK